MRSIITLIHQVITSYGFEVNIVDDCVYYKFSGSKYVFLILYVDTTVAKEDKFSLKQCSKIILKGQ